MAKKLNVEEAARSLALLAQEFPECFTLATPQPLKIDIKKDIIKAWGDAPKFSKTKLQQALYFYTNSAAYLNAFKLEPVRVDLHGNPVEDVLESDRDYAFRRYCSLYKKPKPEKKRMSPFSKNKTHLDEVNPQLNSNSGFFAAATPKDTSKIEIIKKPSRHRSSLLKKEITPK
jgi:ProP effector